MEELDKSKSGNPMEGESRGALSIEEFLKKDEQKDLLRFLTAGSVDDGKSTLIGRLLFDSKKLYEDQLDALERDSKRMGNAGEHIDYALLLDGLKAEREQGITIDVAYRYFSTNNRKFIIADTPGHEQYTRNMITGGSTANLAIILVDARTGVITQTRRHTYLVSLLGIKHVVLAVNKMDLVDFSKEVFDKIVSDYRAFIDPLGIPDVNCIPLSALDGDNVVEKSDRTPWYEGPSLLEFLETVHIGNDHNLNDFRYPVQYVLRPNLDFRGFCGKVASGIIRKGDEVMALPSGKKSHVKSIVTYDGELDYAYPPMSVTLTLEDVIGRCYVNHVFHTIYALFQRHDDTIHHRISIGSRISSIHFDGRRCYVRILFHRQCIECYESDNQNQDGYGHSHNRSFDEYITFHKRLLFYLCSFTDHSCSLGDNFVAGF